MFVHELAHVADHREKARIWAPFEPDFPFKGAEAALWGWADKLWSEYRACRIASNLDPEGVTAHAELLAERLEPSRSALIGCIKEYRFSGDLTALLEGAGRHYGFLLKQAAYTLGGLDSLGRSLDEVCPVAAAALSASSFRGAYDALGAELRRLAGSYPEWTHPEDLRGLMEAVRSSFAQVGLVHRTMQQPDGHADHVVDVPFTDDTLPSHEEHLAIAARLGLPPIGAG